MKEPIVSVFVCTYNSSKTVLETLESIKSQTYNNIELIISDDCSSDASVSICERWIDENEKRFLRTKIIAYSPNTGTSANVNRAYEVAKGEWVKGIAADDKLLPNCISDFVEYINNHPESNIIFSKVIGFGDMEAAKKWPFLNVKRFFDVFSAKQFRIILSTQNFLPAPSVFLKRDVWKSVGGFIEDIPLLEDWPFWVKTLADGYKFDFMDKETVCYRFSESSISQGDKPLSKAYLESNSKAACFASRSLAKINLLYWYYYQTNRLAIRVKKHHYFVLYMLNIFNPAYREFEITINRFKEMI